MAKESVQARHARQMKPVTLHAATRAAIDEALAKHRGGKARTLGDALAIVERQTGEVTHGAANALAKYLQLHVADVYEALYRFQQAGPAAKKKLMEGKPRVKVMAATGATKPGPKKTAASKQKPTPNPTASKARAKTKPAGTRRGTALVEEVIERVRSRGLLRREPSPLDPAVLAGLRFSSGEPLPSSLATWLAFDSGPFDAGSLPLVVDAKKKTIPTLGFADMFQQAFSFGRAEMHAIEQRIPARCVLLPVTSDSKRFLYLGKPDEHGELPVFVVVADDVPQVFLEYPGLDVLLAVRFGVVSITMTGYCDLGAHPDFGAAWKQQARVNLPTGALAYDEL